MSEIRITVNGEPRTIASDATVADLVQLFRLAPERVAVERNEALVRRANFGSTKLSPDDRIEIVTLVGGG